jgi:hypothetical protein
VNPVRFALQAGDGNPERPHAKQPREFLWLALSSLLGKVGPVVRDLLANQQDLVSIILSTAAEKTEHSRLALDCALTMFSKCSTEVR